MQAFNGDMPVGEMVPVPDNKREFNNVFADMFKDDKVDNVKFFQLTPTQKILFQINRKKELKGSATKH